MLEIKFLKGTLVFSKYCKSLMELFYVVYQLQTYPRIMQLRGSPMILGAKRDDHQDTPGPQDLFAVPVTVSQCES